MAPVKKKNNSTPKNAGRKRVIKEKKVLKKPTVIKIKLPLQQKENSKNLSMQRKIELANEVARTQLCKDAQIDESSCTPLTVKTPIKNKKETVVVEGEVVSPTKVPKPRGRKPKQISDIVIETNKTEVDPDATTGNIEQKPNKRVVKKKTIPKTTKGKSPKSQVKSTEITEKNKGKPAKKNMPTITPKTRSLRSNTVKNKDVPENTPEQAAAAPIESRTNSATSSLSWTRDISTSSTTTCITVSSHDVVRVDRRVPVVQLHHVDARLAATPSTTDSSSDSDSHSDSSKSTDDVDDDGDEVDTVDTVFDVEPDPPISPSQFIADLNLSSSTDMSHEDNTYSLLRQIHNMKLNQQHLANEIDKLFPESPSDDIERDFSKILRLPIIENEALKQSKCMRNICEEVLSVDRLDETKRDSKASEPETALLSSSEPASTRSYENDNINTNNENYTAFDENTPEDEDALSLFAESITDVETTPAHDEYVPLPRKPPPRETFTYRPTKITNTVTDDHTRSEPGTNVSEPPSKGVAVNAASPRAPWIGVADRPRFIASMYKPIQGVKSSVFKGVCFFNLISGCKNMICRHRHEVPALEEIQRRLAIISEDSFIQEYILMRTWPELRRKYGLCFVNECDKRELTNVLVEMGIDFVTKANLNSREDAELKVVVLEIVLMHLNRVRLEQCADLLRYTVPYAPFYHTLMKTIADTQNFSRFKAVFVKLARFIIEAGGAFDIDTVAKILERVCILPFDESLVRAMLSLIQNTDRKIYDNSMMNQFRVLLEQLDEGGGAAGDSAPIPALPHSDVEAFVPTGTTDNERQHSAPIAAPKIIRTIDLKRVKGNTLRQFRGPSTNVRQRFKRWGPRSPHIRPQQRHISFPTPPPLFTRRPVKKPNF